MRIFISWSGPRSRKVAEYLSGWLRKLPLTVRPWVSKEAIEPGTRWEKELSEALEGTTFGILCLTPENQLEPWICFETGALSKTVEKTHVIPYLIDMTPNDLKHPLKQFQAIDATKEGTFYLIKTIYKTSGDDARSMEDINEAFETFWPKLEDIINEAKKESIEAPILEEAGFPKIINELGKIIAVLESLSIRMSRLERQLLSKPPWLKDEPVLATRLSDILKSESSPKSVGKYLADLLPRHESDSALKELQDIIEGLEKKKSELNKSTADE